MRRAAFTLLFTAVLVLPSFAAAQGSEPPPTILTTLDHLDIPYDGWDPQGVAFDRWGNLYVTNRAENNILKFDTNGTFLEAYGTSGGDPGEFNWPAAIDVDDAGNIYVLERGNNRVQVLDRWGDHVTMWTEAWGTNDFLGPRGLAVTPSGEVFVTDTVMDGVFVFDSAGGQLGSWGGSGSSEGYFQSPRGLDIGPDGLIYVCDYYNNRIQVFEGLGLFQWAWEDGAPGVNLREPTDLAVDLFGNVYLMEDDSRLSKLATDGTLLSSIPGFAGSEGVAQFGYGTLAAVAGLDHSVHKLGYPPELVAAADVGPDQGGWLRLTWSPSPYDLSTLPTAVTGYGVYRRIDDKVMEDWDFIATVPARGDLLYNLVAPTLCDSTDAGVCWSVFAVTAFTSYGEYHDSPPDSGYSVDDLPPDAPAAPSVEENPGVYELAVSWAPSAAPDLGLYRIYRGAAPDFTPTDPAAPDFETTGLSVVDPAVAGGETWYYRVAAVDDAGNVSPYSPAAGATVLTGAGVPAALVLNAPTPNPFNPHTSVVFALPAAEAVDLRVHDLTGRVVRTLADGRLYGPGRHEVGWDGTDDAGRALASGVYVVRLRAGGQLRSVRVALVR